MKQDSSWRKILDKLLPEFLAFYFSEIHQAIDFEKGFEFLDKELQKILPQEDDTGKRVVDKLVKVFLRDGSEKWLLIHDEELIEEIKQTTEEKQMSVLAVAERVGMKQGLKEAISDILEIKFGMTGLALFNRVEQVTDLESLQKIRTGLKQAKSVAEAEALIHAYAKERS